MVYSNWNSLINTTPSVPHPGWPDAPCATFATWLLDLRRLLSANINLFNPRLYRDLVTIFISSSYVIRPFVIGPLLYGEQSLQDGFLTRKNLLFFFREIDVFYIYMSTLDLACLWDCTRGNVSIYKNNKTY